MAAKVQYKSVIYSKFFVFLKFCIGTSEQTCTIVGEKEWSVLFKIAERQGIVILTDSDGAGQLIRKYLEKLVPKDRVKNLYLPELQGKEKRKTSPSAAGLLGVEGTDNEIILAAAKRAGILSEITEKEGKKISK